VLSFIQRFVCPVFLGQSNNLSGKYLGLAGEEKENY
jgi:hypothetical protein